MRFPVPSETFATTEVAALRRHGVDVEVHALRPPAKMAHDMLAERGLADLTVTHGTFGNQFRGWLYGVRHPILLLSLVGFVFRFCWYQPRHLAISLLLTGAVLHSFARIQANPPEVVHLFWGHYPSLLGYLVQNYLPTVVLTTSLSAYDVRMHYGGSAPVVKRCRMVRTWARVNIPEIKEYGARDEQIAVYYQCLDISKFDRIENVPRVRGRIATVSRLIPAKKVDKVLRILRDILPEAQDTSLVIMGDGPERPRLEQLASDLRLGDRVQFLGHVSQDRVFCELRSAEVFLFLSEHDAERLPNVVKEAMAAGCLCIVSETPGIDEVLIDGLHGYIAKDLNEAKQRLLEVLDGHRDFGTINRAARQKVLRDFDSDHIIPAILEQWTRLVGKLDENRSSASK